MAQALTAVSLIVDELQALIELARIASSRLSVAEQLYYNGLLTRMSNELEAQTQDNGKPSLGPAIPLGTSPDS